MPKKIKEDFLESLSKYETFNDITHLNISKKKLKKIDILPKNLIELDCSHNQLTSLFSEKCNIPKTLVKINCSHNQILSLSDEKVNMLKNLINIDCSYNRLTSINLEFFEKLKILNCSYNKIEFVKLPDSVENINMDKNKLTGNLMFPPKIKILSANKNLLSSFDWKHIPISLNKLYLNNNLIETLEREAYDSDDEERIVYFNTCSYIELKNNGIKDNDRVHIHGYVIYEDSDSF
jgi:Leucine-rich repeat (LRR) protein